MASITIIRITDSVKNRFWAKVHKRGPDECWPWIGAYSPRGYGTLEVDGKEVKATHLALTIDGRPRPSQDHGAMHSCDSGTCCNAGHLFWERLIRPLCVLGEMG